MGGIFSKIPLRLGPNYLFPNHLVTDGAGEKGKASHAMGGHLVQQPTPGWVRAGVEEQALVPMTPGTTQGWPPFDGERRLGMEKGEGGAMEVSQGHTVGREAPGQS